MADTQLSLPASGRIGIVNRGEAALRFIRALREFNNREGSAYDAVCFHIEGEKDALFVQESDFSFPLSAFSEFAAGSGSPYLNRALMLQALRETGCVGAWVGWGFLSEDAEFAGLLEKNGLVFLGPSASAMALLGDKIAAKRLAEQAQVPILPWSREAVAGLEEARRFAESIGYPCIIKAANAGGGRGIRFVPKAADLPAQFNSAVEETRRITGNTVVFMERLVERGRHLEVQVLADRQGCVRTFGVRDCSVQRKNQKIVEETPPPAFDQTVIGDMEAAAARLIEAAGYYSAGTVEFLYDLDRSEFYFMEVNTRLQVEHPITEQLYGIDLVRGQLLVARGESVADFPGLARGCVIEVRLNAEDPDRDFRPAPGRVLRYKMPSGPGIRVDSGIEQRSVIPADFDSMVAKLIASGPDRATAIARLERALLEMRVKIEGGTTNRAFLLELLGLPELRAGGVHTRFVEEYLAGRPAAGDPREWAVALAACAIEQWHVQHDQDFANFSQQLGASAFPRQVSPAAGYEAALTARGVAYRFKVEQVGLGQYLLSTEHALFSVRYKRREEDGLLYWGERCYHIQLVERGDLLQCEVNGRPFVMEMESGGVVKAPSPALVLSIPVAPGQAVAKGEVLVTLEAMKMEMVVPSPEAGTVKAVHVKPGEQVAAGRPLVELELGQSSGDKPAGRPVDLSPYAAAGPAAIFEAAERRFSAIFLGFDCAPGGRAVLAAAREAAEARPEFGARLQAAMRSAMEAYAAIERLFSGERAVMEGFARQAGLPELLGHFFRRSANRDKGFPESFLKALERALTLFGLSLKSPDRLLRPCLFQLYRSHAAAPAKSELLELCLARLEADGGGPGAPRRLFNLLDELAGQTQAQRPVLADAAINARYRLFDRPLLESAREAKRVKADRILELMARTGRHEHFREDLIVRLLDYSNSSVPELVRGALDPASSGPKRGNALETLARWLNRDRACRGMVRGGRPGAVWCRIEVEESDRRLSCWVGVCAAEAVSGFLNELAAAAGADGAPAERELVLYLPETAGPSGELAGRARAAGVLAGLLHIGLSDAAGGILYSSYSLADRGYASAPERHDLSPLAYRELRLARLAQFETKLLHSAENVRLLQATARDNPRDERLFAFVEVGTVRPEFDEDGTILRMVGFDSVFMDAVYALRGEQLRRKNRLYWNRIVVSIRSALPVSLEQIGAYARVLAGRTLELGMERMTLYSRMRAAGGGLEQTELSFENITGVDFTLAARRPSDEPLRPIDAYTGRVVRCRQRGTVYPYEIIKMLTREDRPGGQPAGDFEEFDLAPRSGPAGFWRRSEQAYVSVKGRPYGGNTGNIVFGLIENRLTSGRTARRVIILSDPTADLGSLAEAECLRINAALDLAEDRGLPAEWIPVSAGARIDMQSGTENLDWTACTLRRIIEFTQAGGELNVIVAGINVGAQSYWNAEATMLMHTRGLLIMTDEACMLLTGKKALDFSGSVSAADNLGIGGAQRIMEPNGQAQVRARNLKDAYELLFRHYELCYAGPGEVFPPRAAAEDPSERDVGRFPYADALGQGFATVGDIFSRELNPERKKPFDIRQVMRALVDQDQPVLERWPAMSDAETAVVWEARIGGWAAGLIGIESRNLTRQGEVPHDGPEAWSGGTLFPLSSKKTARAINAASGRLPLVILANLSGFDGSPESLRKLQLEYGAEIGRAVVNFKGPLVFVVIARYHGGAYVVFSKSLNPRLHAVSLEGAYASVIGGAPAAAVVFPGQVRKDAYQDPRVADAQAELKARRMSQADYDELFKHVHAEKQAALAQRFDQVHSVERARAVGSIDEIVSIARLRPYVIERLEAGMRDYLESPAKPPRQ